jgi:hypothetical protein
MASTPSPSRCAGSAAARPPRVSEAEVEALAALGLSIEPADRAAVVR